MSRLAGLISEHGPNESEVLLNRMLRSFNPSGQLHQEIGNLGQARFGSCHRMKPALFQSESTLVVIDGSIYNADELGLSETIPALIATLYLDGDFVKVVQKLNGDFSIALFDLRRRALWLARDRMGVKPLYFVSLPGSFAFASQPKALLALPSVEKDPNQEFVALYAASHYRYFDNCSDGSAYRHIKQLPAAHVLQVVDGRLDMASYWSIPDLPEFTEPEGDLALHYRDLLFDSVSLRLKCADHPGFTLSGGMDSSSVLASAVSITGRKQQAFSTVYDDRTYDESAEIQTILKSTVEAWHTVRVGTPNVLDVVRDLVEIHDEPVATATWLSHHLLCQQARSTGVRSLFGGLGGDELNAGEYEYFILFFADLKSGGQEEQLEREVAQWIAHHDHPIFKKSFDAMKVGLAGLVDLTRPGRCLPDRARLTRYSKALNPEYYDLGAYEPAMKHPFASYLRNRAYQDLFWETTPCCLRAEDRQTHACGLDHFLPFLDYRLVEFMFRVSGSLKIRDGVTKYLLRQSMKGILPEETRTRIKKTGWNAPAHLWFAGRGKESLLDLVHSRRFRERGIYNLHEVIRLIEEHDVIVSSGLCRENHTMFLWQLVNLELWLQNVDRKANEADESRVAVIS